MTKSSREWKQPAHDLWDLTLESKWAEGSSEDCRDYSSQLDAVEELDSENGFRRQAVRPKQEDEVGRGQVEIDVLHAEQGCENDPALQQS
jgi:hypothetical protein